MFGFKKKNNVVAYKGYVIREGYFPSTDRVWFWQHDDAEAEHDQRRGWSYSLIDAKADIDDQIAEGVK